MALDAKMVSRNNAEALMKPEQVTELVKLIGGKSVTLSKMRRLPNMTSDKTRIPVLETLPMAYFVHGDNGQKQTTNAEWKDKFITAEEIAVIVPFPESVIADAQYNLTAEMIPLVADAFAKVIDAAIVEGTNAPASWPMGLIPMAVNQKNIVNLSGSATDQEVYKKILGKDGLYATVEHDGFEVNGLLGNLEFKSILRGLTDTTGRPLTVGGADVNGQAVGYVKNGAWTDPKNLLLAGDFTKAVYAIRQDITMKKFTEGVIQNKDGSIAYNLMQNDMIAIRFVMRMGWQVANPVSQLNPDKETRFPLAILQEAEATALKNVTVKVYSDAATSSPVQDVDVIIGDVMKKTSSGGQAVIGVPNGFSGTVTLVKGDLVRHAELKNVTSTKTVTVSNFKAETGIA